MKLIQQLISSSGRFRISRLSIVTIDFCRDNQGEQCFYEPVAVIEYLGNLSQMGQSTGHYICDVKQVSTKQWYRTNDKCSLLLHETSL